MSTIVVVMFTKTIDNLLVVIQVEGNTACQKILYWVTAANCMKMNLSKFKQELDVF